MLRMILVGLLGFHAVAPGEVSVWAAASLSDVMSDVAKLYELRVGGRLVVNTGASNILARQIRAGARADLFFSADEAQMDAVAEHVVPGTRRDVLSNQLAIAVPSDRPRRLASARDLLDPSIRRIAIGDAAAVPAGVYAREYLETLGLWDAVAPKTVPAGSVRLALAAVENGAADAAIVYRTDLLSARRAHEAFVVPVAEGPRIMYPAAVIKGGSNPDGARRLLEFLNSPEVRAAFRRAGFVPVAPVRTLK
jgi:molybdate transport system substrate-binding protein